MSKQDVFSMLREPLGQVRCKPACIEMAEDEKEIPLFLTDDPFFLRISTDRLPIFSDVFVLQ